MVERTQLLALFERNIEGKFASSCKRDVDRLCKPQYFTVRQSFGENLR